VPLISIEDLFVAYGKPARAVLAGVNVEIEEGEFVCLLGQTGCGKSTLLRLVLGSEQPMRGRILIDGREHRQPDVTRGYVPQRYSLFPDRTVIDNILFGPMLKRGFFRRPSAGLRDEAYEYLRRIGLREADAGKYPHQLSGGMQQRVAIAQALINRPRILLMDEAFSALDSGTRREMQGLVRELWKATGTTILFVTHNIDEALRLGTRVLVLAKEGPDQGSRVAMDLEVPDPCTEEAIPPLVLRLEQAS
jgi:NitT/TauT family transport system ATP-binding protein